MVCVVPIDRTTEPSLAPLRTPPAASGELRDRIPSLLAAARRLLDENEAHDVVEEVIREADALMREFRAASPGVWLQGLVVGLSVSRVRPRLRRHGLGAEPRAGREADAVDSGARPWGDARLR